MTDLATLRIRYPALAPVDDDTAQYWLDDAGRTVVEGWGDDREPATLALAAHNIVTSGALAAVSAGAIPAGVTSFKSGTFSATLSDAFVSAQVKGGYGSTPYGVEFLTYLRRHAGGPVLVGPVPCANGGEWW